MKRFILTTALLLGIATASRAEVPAPEKLLPDDTLIVYTIPDFNKIRDTYKNSPHGLFWNDPAMKAFKDKFVGKLTSDFITPLETQLSVHFNDYANLPQGQATFAMSSEGLGDPAIKTPSLLFLLDTKTNSAQLKTNLTDLKKKWVDAGKTIKTEKIRDVDFSVALISKEDMPKLHKKSDGAKTNSETDIEPFENPELKNAPKKQIYIGQVDSLLIMGNSSKFIEKVLAKLSGADTKSLADVSLFSDSASIFHDAQMYGWVNTKTMVDTVLKAPDDAADADNPSPLAQLKPKKIITALGLAGLNSVSLSYNYAPDGARFNVLLASPDSSRAGLFKMIEGEKKDTSPPSFVPSDAVKFQRWRLDGQKLWDSIRKMVGDINPGYVSTLDFVIGSAESQAKEKDPNFDLKKDLFGNLGDDIISYQKNPKGDSLADLNNQPAIYLIGSPNPSRLLSAVRGLLILTPQKEGADKDRDFLGHKIYTQPLSPASGSVAERKLSYTVSGTYLAVATQDSILEEYLRSSETPPKALKDMPGLSDATSKIVGSETSLFGFSNDSETMKLLFNLMKKDTSGADPLGGLAPLIGMMGGGNVVVKDWVDVTLLPDFDQVAKYFNFSVYSFNAGANGLMLKTFSPVPPQLTK